MMRGRTKPCRECRQGTPEKAIHCTLAVTFSKPRDRFAECPLSSSKARTSGPERSFLLKNGIHFTL
ncbi:MAG: hypothetical protein JSV84_16775 [Gemmatimonadota bacterium]|nr:MAG: hypothetical protein JSV84_16775 [Gemmatimonadota bacterium]